jgi:uncharacterized protein
MPWLRKTFLLVAVVAAGCGHSAAPPLASFGYDAASPLGYVDRGAVARVGTLAVHDVSYRSGGRRVDGYLVEPSGGARPGVVLVHGSGGDRRELLGFAVALARRGAVALTITAPSSSQPPPRPRSMAALLEQSRAITVADVVAVRRAADLLSRLPVVDPRRLGFLGWSAGAKTGTFVAAADHRFRALALLSAGAAAVGSFVAAAPAAERSLVRRNLTSIDPIRAVLAAQPGTLLLEDGTNDTVVPHVALQNIIDAAPPGTTVRWYRAGHALDNAAYQNAFTWLLQKLRK